MPRILVWQLPLWILLCRQMVLLARAQDLPSTPPPLLVEEEAKKVQELETFGEDMDAEFLDALVAAETEAAVKAGFGDTATVEEVDKSSTDLASSYVCQLASSDNFVAHSASQEGSETAVVREGPETIPMDVALEVAEKPEEPLDTHVPTKVPCQDVDLVTARRSTELAEECADSTGEFQDHKSMENVEKSPDVESCDPEASATGVPLGNLTDDPSAMEPSAEMLVSGISMNTTGPEAPNLSVEVSEAAV